MSEPVNCASAERMTSDLIAGDLDELLQDELAEHFENCDECRNRAVELYKQDRALLELGSDASIKELKNRIHDQLKKAAPTVQKAAPRKLRTVRIGRQRPRGNPMAVPL